LKLLVFPFLLQKYPYFSMCYKTSLSESPTKLPNDSAPHQITEKRTNPQTYPQGYPQIQWITFKKWLMCKYFIKSHDLYSDISSAAG